MVIWGGGGSLASAVGITTSEATNAASAPSSHRVLPDNFFAPFERLCAWSEAPRPKRSRRVRSAGCRLYPGRSKGAMSTGRPRAGASSSRRPTPGAASLKARGSSANQPPLEPNTKPVRPPLTAPWQKGAQVPASVAARARGDAAAMVLLSRPEEEERDDEAVRLRLRGTAGRNGPPRARDGAAGVSPVNVPPCGRTGRPAPGEKLLGLINRMSGAGPPKLARSLDGGEDGVAIGPVQPAMFSMPA